MDMALQDTSRHLHDGYSAIQNLWHCFKSAGKKYIYIFKGTSPPISLDFYHFAATFGNFHNIESSSTQAGTSISRLRIQVLLPRHERHRAAVLAAKWRRLASVPLGSGPAVHRIDDMEKKHLFVPFNST